MRLMKRITPDGSTTHRVVDRERRAFRLSSTNPLTSSEAIYGARRACSWSTRNRCFLSVTNDACLLNASMTRRVVDRQAGLTYYVCKPLVVIVMPIILEESQPTINPPTQADVNSSGRRTSSDSL